jgi:C1A family cysteine protease
MKEVLKYACEHCKREYKVKSNAEHHENICWNSPKLKTCITCIFFDGFDYANDNGSDFLSNRYIVCKEYPDLLEDDKPIVNCEHWVHDQRTKKQKKQEEFNKLINELNKTGLTF